MRAARPIEKGTAAWRIAGKMTEENRENYAAPMGDEAGPAPEGAEKKTPGTELVVTRTITEEIRVENIAVPVDRKDAAVDAGDAARDSEDSAADGSDWDAAADSGASPAGEPGNSPAGTDSGETAAAENPQPEEDVPKSPEKVNVIGVRFRTAGKVYYFDPGELIFRRGDHVIVETARGVEYGEVILGNMLVPSEKIVQPLKPIIRAADGEDDERERRNREKAEEAYHICREKIAKHSLEMKLVDAEYTFDNNKILFYFTADGRVDFRDLVKDLASVFRTRIELRQIGVRDETKLLGGIGMCGRPLCCHSYLGDFASVSIRMAKDQNLSLNPSKISGVCGRLMCCLKNEEETYQYLNSKMPSIGDWVTTPDDVRGQVQSVNVLRQTVRVMISTDDDEKEIHDYPVAEITFTPRRKGGRNRDGGEAQADRDNRQERGEAAGEEVLQNPEERGSRQSREGRGERGNRPGREGRVSRQGREERQDRGNSPDREGRGERGNRQSRNERTERGNRPDREGRGERGNRPDREGRGERGNRPDREGRGERGNRPDREGRGERGNRPDRAGRADHGNTRAREERGNEPSGEAGSGRFGKGNRERRPRGENRPRPRRRDGQEARDGQENRPNRDGQENRLNRDGQENRDGGERKNRGQDEQHTDS